MSKSIYLFSSIVILFFSCGQDRVYEEFIALDNQTWNASDSLNFDLGELDLNEKKTLLALRFNEQYGYSNCYIRVISKDSTQSVIGNKLLDVPLFDSKTGEPLGNGFGSTFTKYDTLPFSIPENTKSITLLQYMRVEDLPGIEAAGIKIID
ncbi:gliding motility lipoprotein GldH [Algoriphagus hitonicola]|uniref:Gliding motility-associated lipoprotein GldH n=1 Tax=Algoriphagus hitonicola TaxID=435880 RepID=A0A1I2NLF4_9BACT|nr:gliding motility lipoprotein GldH [Algoriphagus hitonicola]SFG04403.1 gliding motility-associated lipoprotein GldH [Algoriphagus hitonicola]